MKPAHIFILATILTFVGIGFYTYTQSQTPAQDTSESTDEEKSIDVMVSILPQVEFVEKIGGEYVNVEAMIREGFSPATYEATPEQMKQLEDTDLYVRIGYVPFEEMHMEKIADANPDMNIVDSSKGIETRTIEAHTHEGEEEHGHEEDEDHAEEGVDPHIWLSPKRVQQQVETITNALVEMYPEQEETFKINAQNYIAELQELDSELAQSFSSFQGKTMFVYHPAFGYLADDYGFTQEHIEIEGKEPSLTQVQEIAEKARAENVSVIFVQKQFSTQSAEAIAQEINGTVVPINPLAQDYTENMRSIAQTITKSIE
jgi:zinc transport system substrate-binding protein